MANLNVQYIVINDKNHRMSPPCTIRVSSSNDLAYLTRAIRADFPTHFALVDPTNVAVWRWSGVLAALNKEELYEQLEHFNEKEGVKRPESADTLSSLKWSSESDLLVVQIASAAPVHVSYQDHFQILPKIPEQCRNMAIKATQQKSFVDADVLLNDLRESTTSADAPFVTDFKQMLSRRRVCDRGAFLVCEEENFHIDTGSKMNVKRDVHEKLMEVLDLKPVGEDVDVNDQEMTHLCSLVLYDFFRARDCFGRLHVPRRCKEDIANAILFFPFQCCLDGFYENGITYGFGYDDWPFKLLVQIRVQPGKVENKVNKWLFICRPRSNFVVLKEKFPRLLVEVESDMRGIRRGNRNRLLVESGSILRFANTHLDKYQKEKNFLLVAIYIHDSGRAERFVLYQEKGSNKVYWMAEDFLLTEDADRLKFACELYNFASALAKENTGNSEEINKFNQAVSRLERDFRLEEFTATKHSTSGVEDSWDRSRADPRISGSGGGDADELEAHGYEVVPDTFEDEKGGLWEALVKLPPNIRTVYRASDVNKAELIAKRVRKRSSANENELQILQYLRTNRPLSPHVIMFIDSIATTTETWLIFPKLHTIADQLSFNGGRYLRGKIERFSWGLIKGLAYLHENGVAHLDIKPDNLLYDDTYQLKIVDFDVAARVKDEDEEVEGYRGTRGWTAPEVGEEDDPKSRYSAIKADRWSCGRVLLSFLKIEAKNRVLSTVADQLTSSNPHKRPSLLEWHKWCEAAESKSDGADVSDLDSGGVRRLREGVMDEDDVQAPIAKKPKLRS